MSRYWIFDREDTPQGFPLRVLVASIRDVVGSIGCRFLIRKCRGYGAKVNDWDERLDHAEEITVSADELEQLSGGAEEWFYDLEARCVTPTGAMGFGLHDRSAMYLDAPAELAAQITTKFERGWQE